MGISAWFRPYAFALLFATFASQPLAAQTQKGTLVFAVESLSAQTLDPILEGRPGNAIYQAVMYDSLVGFDLQKGGIGPGVAQSWELAEDGSTWTFHLRPGQKFHNGDPLTAQDVKFSLQRQLAPNSIAAAAATLRRTIKSIDVVDDLTLNVNTNSPQIGLPASLSRAVAPEGAVMPKAYIEKVGEEEFRRKPIGSGPWRFVRSVPGDRIEYEAVEFGAICRCRLNFTSCAVSGSPLWNFWPGRRWNVQVDPSSASSQLCATPGPMPPFCKSNPTRESYIAAW